MFELKLYDGAADRLRKALVAFSTVADTAVVDISPEVVDLSPIKRNPQGFTVCGLLRIRPPPSTIAVINCDAPAAFLLQLSDLIQALILAVGADDNVVLTFRGRQENVIEDHVGFRFIKPAFTGSSRIQIWNVEPLQWNTPTNGYEYRTIIVIRAEYFMYLIVKLQDFADDVSVKATRTEVMFSAANEEVILRTQPGANVDTAGCTIEGIQNADEVSFSFSLRFREAIINTCKLSGIIRLLHSDDLKPVLNCAVGRLGNMMLFF